MIQRRPMMVLMLVFCMSLLMVAMSCSDKDDDNNNPTALPTATPTPDATPTATPANDYNIVGVWAYTMAQEGEIWDSGTITFTGTTASGAFTQNTVHNAEYTGTYTVSGNAVSLKGPEDWTGTFSDANTMSGTWTSNDTPDTGAWTMTRQ